MKKLFVVAALLMATTSAHAGNSISFEIQGHKVHIEAPKDCNALSCLKVSAPGLSGSGLDFKGFKSKHFDDGDDVAERSDPAAQTAALAPAAQAAAPQPVAPVASTAAPASTAVASNAAMPAVGFETPSAPAVTPSQPAPVAAAPIAAPATPLGIWATEEGKGDVRVEPCGPVRICRELRRENPHQHEAVRHQMDRSDSRSGLGQDLRLDDRDEGTEYLAGPGLRLRRHVLRRPDLEANQLEYPVAAAVALSWSASPPAWSGSAIP
jgi:hypothetical protein